MIFFELFEQIIVKLRNKREPILTGLGYPQVIEDRSKQLAESQLRIKNECRMDSRFQIVHDGSEQSGLTSAHLAGHDNETLPSFNAVTQGCKDRKSVV